MLKKILVANRGEIAIRVMRACRELDIETVAVHSDVDKDALFAKYADESYEIGEGPPHKSYLNIDKIIGVAKATGCDGIHPGYGFLAENAKFASSCADNGIVFVGPSPDAIEKMGDKIVARRLMKQAGVPVVPGSIDEVTEIKEAKKIADKIGYPVIIKAAGGGGGIGMRVVRSEKDLEPALEITRNMASSAFGNPSIFIEKYLEQPRHIEIQILADSQGNTFYLGERECSIQRRHQKLIEESPSPVMTPELRQAMGEVAVKAAKAIDYVNAGTIEFMFSEGNYYFLEMNTRIQVEHPITEMVTDIDIVKEQIRVAGGLPLDFTQDDIRMNGWAIECRINAEDPQNNFAPMSGKIRGYRSPGGVGVRVDSGVHAQYVIPPFYDSMISKLVVHGRDRDEAIQRMKRALYEYIILGVTTNIPFHKAVMLDPVFIKGELSTHYIEEQQHLAEEMRHVIEDTRSLQEKLTEIFKDDRKAAAVSAAVSAYLANLTAADD
jgi:pyruvate carboxylase subunit A